MDPKPVFDPLEHVQFSRFIRKNEKEFDDELIKKAYEEKKASEKKKASEEKKASAKNGEKSKK